MTVAAGLGYALIALGPALSLFAGVVATKPFLVLTLLSRHLVLAYKFDNSLGNMEGVPSYKLRSLVAIRNSDPYICCIARGYPSCVLEALQKMEEMLDAFADRISKPRLSLTDKMLISLAGGLGHGVAHAVFFCLSLLTPAFGRATFYVERCSRMPFFLASAIIALGFLVIHTFSMIIAFNAYDERKKSDQIFVPVIHLTAGVMDAGKPCARRVPRWYTSAIGGGCCDFAALLASGMPEINRAPTSAA
ncbi:hypothetical protein ACP4OV_010080 [Aristida adscensionis]